ncbi:insulin-resistance promoting peptide in skeletal muscle domain-containing protein [Cordyceps javanica]|nr:insulin-resistance promoting peptide in skeletal muscle domain-containing protein [Cordyceps javanica]
MQIETRLASQLLLLSYIFFLMMLSTTNNNHEGKQTRQVGKKKKMYRISMARTGVGTATIYPVAQQPPT